MKLTGLILFSIIMITSVLAEEYWVGPMTAVHKTFKGKKGSVACFGDSITSAKEFWATIPNGVKNCKDIKVDELVKYIDKNCWNLKGIANGNKGGWKITDGLEGVDEWLENQNPEVSIVCFGGNDTDVGPDPIKTKFQENLEIFVQKCLDKGSIVILSTTTPAVSDKRAEKYNVSIKRVALEKKVPLVDYYEEIVKRRPKDWDGTLTIKDNGHPTWHGENDWSEEALKSSGYSLRNYVTLKEYQEVYDNILKK